MIYLVVQIFLTLVIVYLTYFFYIIYFFCHDKKKKNNNLTFSLGEKVFYLRCMLLPETSIINLIQKKSSSCLINVNEEEKKDEIILKNNKILTMEINKIIIYRQSPIIQQQHPIRLTTQPRMINLAITSITKQQL